MNRKIGKSAVVAISCVIAGSTQIGDGATVWTAAVVGPRIKIGKNAVVGMNSSVLADVPDGMTVVGSPAKESIRGTAKEAVNGKKTCFYHYHVCVSTCSFYEGIIGRNASPDLS